MQGADAVAHTVTLNKPHLGSHGRQDFVDTDVSGTLILLEAAVAAGVGRVVLTSTKRAARRSGRATWRRPAVVRRYLPGYEACTPSGDGGCSRAANASTSTAGPLERWDGRPATTSNAYSTA